MLMEEVVVDWNTLQGTIQDSTLVDLLRTEFTPGVLFYVTVKFLILIDNSLQGVTCYLGRRQRTREVLQHHMYTSEISQWLAEADQLEVNIEIAQSEENSQDRLI